MGDIGIDKWFWKMAEHKRKGHHIIKYPEMEEYEEYPEGGVKESANDIKEALSLKDQRAAFWEEHHRIPTANDLIWWERKAG